MTLRLTLEYLVWVFLLSLGVLQIAFTKAGLRGACFFKTSRPAYLFGGALILGGFLWFFFWGVQAQPGPDGAQRFGFFIAQRQADGQLFVYGVEGQQMFKYFVGAGVAALALTLALTSLTNRRQTTPSDLAPGLEALRNATYWQAMSARIKESRQRWPRQT